MPGVAARGRCLAGLAGLFLAAFVAATLLPAQSEAVLATLVASGTHAAFLLVSVATAGNVLGSLVNWAIGRQVERFAGRRWFPASPKQMERAKGWYARYGRWSLLASWVPVIGDPLTLAAGIMREPLWSFLLLVTIAKAARYVAVVAATRQIGSFMA
ncbi:DedA family protein [Aureimonas sp. OT7]|nr:DedA family protein [Aureimonas sp. OT7]